MEGDAAGGSESEEFYSAGEEGEDGEEDEELGREEMDDDDVDDEEEEDRGQHEVQEGDGEGCEGSGKLASPVALWSPGESSLSISSLLAQLSATTSSSSS